MRELPERVYASIPDNDPRFAELRAYLEQVRTQDRSSPIPRIMGEWALVGYLFTSGRLFVGGQAIDLSALGVTDPRELSAAQQEVAEAAAGFSFD